MKTVYLVGLILVSGILVLSGCTQEVPKKEPVNLEFTKLSWSPGCILSKEEICASNTKPTCGMEINVKLSGGVVCNLYVDGNPVLGHESLFFSVGFNKYFFGSYDSATNYIVKICCNETCRERILEKMCG